MEQILKYFPNLTPIQIAQFEALYDLDLSIPSVKRLKLELKYLQLLG